MESFDSSPNYMKATSSSDAKKEDHRGRNESDDMISGTSSTCGSSVNGPYKLTSKKFTLKNNSAVARSFRRRVKSRIAQPTLVLSDEESLIDSSHDSPRYSKGTNSSSKGKKTRRGNGESSSSDLQNVARKPNVRNVRVLLKRTSFKPKIVSVNRSTYSSAIKGSKFHDRAAEDYSVVKQSDKRKICRYHHCSLHGHCHGDHDSSQPSKRILYKKACSLKKNRSVMVKTDSKAIYSGEKKKENVKKNQMSSLGINHSNLRGMVICDKDGVRSSKENYNEHEGVGDSYRSVKDSDFLEIAYGEMSYPEASYRENLEIQRKYSFWLTGHCLGCSCHERQDGANLSISASFSSKDCREIAVKSDEITEKVTKLSSSDGDNQDSSGDHTEEEGEFTNEGFASDDAKTVQVKDFELSSPAANGGNLQLSEPRTTSMWNLIHQHLSAKSGSEPENEEPHGQNVQDQIHVSDSKPLGYDDSEEVGDIEVRKLFAIKLVREAIEKILLPEVQDQTSDDQSVGETSNEIGEDGDALTDPKDGASIDDVSASDISVREQKFGSEKSQKKAPKHWSNLKKWILLQRFIKALEEVKKINFKKPNHLPVINPDPEKETVDLRHQTSDERKRSEEWMVDFALRQAVDQLAPTQKRKVALLVKAFETVVPPSEDATQSQFRIPRLVMSEFSNDEEEVISEGNVKRKAGFVHDENQGSGSKRETVEVNLDSPNIGRQGVIDDGNQETVSDLHPFSHPKSVRLDGIAIDDNGVEPTLQHVEKDMIFSGGIERDSKDEQSNMEKESKNHHISMWHMLCQHVVSEIADKMGSQLLDGSDDEESSAVKSGDSCIKPSSSVDEEHRISSNLTSPFTKSDALRIVKKAVEEILVQDDSSDTQSLTGDLTYSSGQETSSEQRDELKDDCSKGPRNEEAEESEISKDPKSVKPKNWVKLKKLILLKRSIKALEKARKLKTQVDMVNDAEQEKINLRQHMMDERAKAEQWMVDYAVRNIVSKLTPSRKQRVYMLVEAFEAVVPMPDL